MRFSTVLVSLVAASGFVAAQSSSTTSAPVPTNTSSYDKATVACLDGCQEEDVNCRAACFGNPHPDENAVNATTQCAMKCEQGDGTEEQTKKYADCQQACIKSLFLTTTGAITPQSSSGSASSTSSSAGSKATGSDADKNTTDSNSEDNKDNTDGDNSEANKDNKDSGAGKLAVSAGGAIALALVALAL